MKKDNIQDIQSVILCARYGGLLYLQKATCVSTLSMSGQNRMTEVKTSFVSLFQHVVSTVFDIAGNKYPQM